MRGGVCDAPRARAFLVLGSLLPPALRDGARLGLLKTFGFTRASWLGLRADYSGRADCDMTRMGMTRRGLAEPTVMCAHRKDRMQMTAG